MRVASVAPFGRSEILHHSDMPVEERRRRHGCGTHTPIDCLTVSEPTTVVFEWVIGDDPVVTGGDLLVVWRWPYDWSDLQSDNPAGDGFMRLDFLPDSDRAGTDDVTLNLKYNWIAGIEPWHHQIRISVTDGELRTGDCVRLTCGDRSQGGTGWRAPTCVDDECCFLMLIDHLGDQRRHRLVPQPAFRTVPGPAIHLRAVAVESDTLPGQPVTVIVRGEDCWGNPAPLTSPIDITADDPAADMTVMEREGEYVRPARHFSVVFAEPGRRQLTVRSASFTAVSNPIVVHETLPERQLYWGDLHSGQTRIGCGSGTLAQSYAFGRDVSGVQFMTHQANDHYVTLEDWQQTREITRQFYEPHRFTPLLGCEWSALTKDGGDRNVFYFDDEPRLRRSDRFFREADPDPTPDARTALDFHAAFRDLNVLVNIHVGGRMTNLQWYEQKIERLCETHSTHGTVEWFFMDALSRGYRVGLTAGTDGVMGRPGADHPGRRLIRNLRNGLTAVYASELTREALWDALQQRRCYATTGERIRLWFEVEGTPMGSEVTTAGHPAGRFEVDGTRPLERIDLVRGTEIIQSWEIAAPTAPASQEHVELRVLWGGTERKGTARLQRVDWAGKLTIRHGTLELIDCINFQSTEDSAAAVSSTEITWACQTAGNAAGILVRVCGNESAELSFHSGPASFTVRTADVAASPRRIDAGGVNRFVQIGPPPSPDGPSACELTFTDDQPVPGDAPYWIRVTQIDQSLAWSSPVYVSRPNH